MQLLFFIFPNLHCSIQVIILYMNDDLKQTNLNMINLSQLNIALELFCLLSHDQYFSKSCNFGYGIVFKFDEVLLTTWEKNHAMEKF